MMIKKTKMYLLGISVLFFCHLGMAQEAYLVGSITFNNEKEPLPEHPAPGAKKKTYKKHATIPPPSSLSPGFVNQTSPANPFETNNVPSSPPLPSTVSRHGSGGSVTENYEKKPQTPLPAAGSQNQIPAEETNTLD